MDGLEAAITQAEVEKALLKLSNGKATGRAGWPAELLRHLAHHVTLDNGRKVKEWMLAPILAGFLNACFNQGCQPASSLLWSPQQSKQHPRFNDKLSGDRSFCTAKHPVLRATTPRHNDGKIWPVVLDSRKQLVARSAIQAFCGGFSGRLALKARPKLCSSSSASPDGSEKTREEGRSLACRPRLDSRRSYESCRKNLATIYY